MIVVFKQHDVACRTRDGRNVVLIEPALAADDQGNLWRCPPGTTSDGPTMTDEERAALKALGCPPDGSEWRPSLFHDAGYRGFLEVSRDGGLTWAKANLSQDECDTLFDAAMRANGVPDRVRVILYQAVHLFGRKAFREGRTT